MNSIFDDSLALFDYTQALRRDFHMHPELGFQEIRTSNIVAQELRKLGIEVSTGIAKTGVVAMIEGTLPGPVVLVRFDMDALPVQEETGAEYASQTPGLMHACGHDGHVAAGLTVARLLCERRQELKGSVKLVFQPAEEGLGGAEGMIAAGVLDNPKPNFCLSMHIWNERPVDWVAIVPGPLMAGSEIFTIKLTGKGGHGAIPNQTIDPVLAGAQIINALQSIVSRNISPLKSAVVTVTAFHAGEAFNVIPQTAELRGTIRTFEPDVRTMVLERFSELTDGVAAAFGCKVDIHTQRLTPSVINDARIAEKLTEAFQGIVPGIQFDSQYRSMVSEDMAYMLEKVPGCYFMVGSANPEKGLNYGHHHPKFDFDESVLPRAAALMTAAVLKILE